MRILLWAVVIALTFYSNNTVAQTCSTIPDCSSLGYTQAASDCVDNNYTACPFDTAKVKCHQTKSCEDMGYIYTSSTAPCEKTVICPHDSTKLACINNPAVGDFKYSLKSSDHKGWWKADGRYINKAITPTVYTKFGSNFANMNTTSKLYPFVYTGVDYDQAYKEYQDNLLDDVAASENGFDYLADDLGRYDLGDIFLDYIDHDVDGTIYENFDSSECSYPATNDHEKAAMADKYIDEISCNLYGLIDNGRFGKANSIIVGAHHDFSREDVCGLAETPGDMSSFFKITIEDVLAAVSENKPYNVLYSNKCVAAAEHFSNVTGENFVAQCLNSAGTFGACDTSTYTLPFYTLFYPSQTTTMVERAISYTPNVQHVRNGFAKVAHTLGISGLQVGLHYFQPVKNSQSVLQAAFWNGSSFSTYNESHLIYKYGANAIVNISTYYTYYVKGQITAFRILTLDQINSNNLWINFPPLHFYCMFWLEE